MSRTDAHRPPHVHLTDAVQEYHDHALGECDLPPLDEFIKHASDRKYRWIGFRCSYWLPTSYQHEHSPYSKYNEDWNGRGRRSIRRGKRAAINAGLADMLDDSSPYDMSGLNWDDE